MAGDVLSAPRRGVMNLLGLPDSGAEAVGNWTGMDKEGLPAQGLGFLLDTVFDPLTYAGGVLGRVAGRGLGALAGQGLERSALARGPGFAGGLEKLASAEHALAGVPESLPARQLLGSIKDSPLAGRIAGEIPPGSRYLPGGNNSLAFQTPQGDVLRIGRETRAAIPEMLQPTRSVRAGDLNVERLPFAQRVGDKDVWAANFKPMSDAIRGQGLHPSDLHPGNVGLVGNNPMLIDPGAVARVPGGVPLPTAPQITARPRGGLADWLLDHMNADSRLQDYLSRSATGS